MGLAFVGLSSWRGQRGSWRRAGLALGFALISGCASLSADEAEIAAPEPDRLAMAQEKSASLQITVSRLKSENARLRTKVMELEREAAATKIAARDAPPPVQSPQPEAAKETAAVELAARDEPAPSTAPAAPIVDAPDGEGGLPAASAPVDESPRLVQPSFASTEEIFENEAVGSDMKMSSVLWGVHLASYRREEEASAGWQKLQRENPYELGLLEPRIEKVSVEGKGEYLRLVGGGFSSREKAAALCNSLEAKGVYCRVASFGGERLSMLDTAVAR